MIIKILIQLIFFLLLECCPTFAGPVTLHQSVEQALATHPRLKALGCNTHALELELRRSRGGYLPSVEFMIGQGLEQYSSEYTRRANADISNTDWQSRSDISVRLIQKIYDGGETGSMVSASKARLDSGNYQYEAAAQDVALDAITAYLSVIRQHELVALAEKNLKFHRDIHKSLAERAKAGAGSIADVHKVQARKSIAESILFNRKMELEHAVDSYKRVVGEAPGELEPSGLPEDMPPTLEDALESMEKNNPELLMLDAGIDEAESKLKLARANYKPRIDLEVGKVYNYHMEGDRSWRDANTAMVVMHWNLYKGGQDKANAGAAAAREAMSHSRRKDKLLELKKDTSNAWEEFVSLGMQEKAYENASVYSRKTLEAYWKQFNVSQRDLLDVLSAETDAFLSASQLASVKANRTIAAYRILKLQGNLLQPRQQPVMEDSQPSRIQ